MHDVVEMLLTRIKDYPEDFFSVPEDNRIYDPAPWSKWYSALQTAKEVMTEEEKVVISDALEMAKRAIYMGAALKTIMSEDVREEPETMKVKSSGRYAVQGIQGPTVTLPSSTDKYLALLGQRQKEAEVQLQQQSLIEQYISGYQNAINNA